MVHIKIADSERDLADVDAQWVNEQVRHYERAHGSLPCVRVTIREPDANVTIVSAACERGLPGVWANPKPAEAEVLEWWRRLKLDAEDWTQGNLVAFIHRLRHLF